MARLGADADQLDALGRDLVRRSAELRSARSTLTAAVTLPFWIGGHADAFRKLWTSQSSVELGDVAAALHDIGQKARVQAEQQRRISGEAVAGPADDGVARAISFNIGRGAGVAPGDEDYEGEDADPGAEYSQLDEVARAIADGRADTVSLQEVHRDDLPRLVQILEDEHDLVYDYEFQPALDETSSRIADNEDPTRRNPYGIAVLSLAPITAVDGGDLPDDGSENRAYQTVMTTIEGQEVSLINTHLSTQDGGLDEQLFPGLVDTPQDRQTRELFDLAVEVGGPLIVTGDLNQSPGELADNAKDYGLDGRIDVVSDRDRPTYDGGSILDYILTTPDLGVLDAENLDEVVVSDHFPIIVDLDLPD